MLPGVGVSLPGLFGSYGAFLGKDFSPTCSKCLLARTEPLSRFFIHFKTSSACPDAPNASASLLVRTLSGVTDSSLAPSSLIFGGCVRLIHGFAIRSASGNFLGMSSSSVLPLASTYRSTAL